MPLTIYMTLYLTVCLYLSIYLFTSTIVGSSDHNTSIPPSFLLVVAEEDLDGKPGITTNLEAILEVRQLGQLLVRQSPAVQCEVPLDPLLGHRFGDHVPAVLDTPLEQALLGGLALLLGELEQCRVLVERRVGAAEARVACAVDALLLAVGHELGRRVIGVELDLVD